MKARTRVLLLLLAAATTGMLTAAPHDVKATTTGAVDSNETWRGEILVTGDVLIPEGVTLTIDPGTTVRFTARRDDQSDANAYDPDDPKTWHATMISITVSGVLDAVGAPDASILFTSDSRLPGPLDWQGIVLAAGGSVVLDHVVLEDARVGLELNAPDANVAITNSTFRNIALTGVVTGELQSGGPVAIADCIFADCRREAVTLLGIQNVDVRHNVFLQNDQGITLLGASSPIEANLFVNNGTGIAALDGGAPAITANQFVHNRDASIIVRDAAPLITHNNMDGTWYAWSGPLHLRLNAPCDAITAEDNWWGSAATADIAETIHDAQDDPNLGSVDFVPFASRPFELDIPEPLILIDAPADRTTESYPGEAYAFYGQGLDLWWDDVDAAIAAFDQAIRRDPYEDAAYVMRGAAWARKDLDDRAVADWEQAIALSWRNALDVY